LVFGSAGAGKSSLINAITGQSLPTGSDARGCTLNTYISDPPFFDSKSGREFIFIDTAGLDEDSKNGSVPGGVAIKNLIKLFRSSREGFNLLILVFRCGRITQSLINNYELFVNKLTNKQIKVLCVITGCENEPGQTNDWVERNQEKFVKSELMFDGMIGTCFAKGGRFEATYEELRKVSSQLVMEKIRSLEATEPVNCLGTAEQTKRIFGNIWNFCCEMLRFPGNWKWINQKLRSLLITIGIEESEADKIAVEIETLKIEN